MVGDHFNQKWNQPDYQQLFNSISTSTNTITRQEFDALKKEVEDMKQLLIKAKIYDEQNNEPNCEMEDKVATLKKIAELMGVNLDEVFKPLL
jgi:uncharacterized protein YlxW (UPF0749 family)